LFFHSSKYGDLTNGLITMVVPGHTLYVACKIAFYAFYGTTILFFIRIKKS
jgi:hypothetical protein